MKLTLYFDVNTPGPLYYGLLLRSIDVIRAQDDGHGESEDAELLDRATSLGRVVVTGDHDFLSIASERQLAGLPFAGVIFIDLYKIDYGRCLDDLEMVCNGYSTDEIVSRVEYLPYKQ